MKRIMYIESSNRAVSIESRIGWVEMPSSCLTYRYGGRTFHKSISGKYNCFDAGSGEKYLVVNPTRTGRDKIHGGLVEIDEDAREEYWRSIRALPDSVHLSSYETTPRHASCHR